MKLWANIFGFLFGHKLEYALIIVDLESAISEEDYAKAEQILIDRKQHISKRNYKEWEIQIKVARDGGIHWKKKNRAVVINLILSFLYCLLIVALILLVTIYLGDIAKLEILGIPLYYIIILGLPVWYCISAGWITRYYRRKYGFRVYDRDFYHVRLEMTISLIVVDLVILFGK